MKKLLFFALMVSVYAPNLTAQQGDLFNDQLRPLLKTEPFRVGVLVQTRGLFSFEDDTFNGGRKYELGATRVDIKGSIDGGFVYRLQTEYRNQAAILDAQVGYKINSDVQIVAGAFKPFTSLDLDPSPAATNFLNRARQVGTMMSTREIGLTLIGKAGDFIYRLGMYNGTGMTRQNDGKFMYSLRAGYAATLQNDGALQFGVNTFINQTEGVNVGNSGLTSAGDRLLYGFYVDYKSDTFFANAELLQTTFDAVQFAGQEETILGYYATIGTRFKEQHEILARVDHLSFDIADRSSNLLSVGWNYYATDVVKFSVNVLTLINDGADNNAGLSAQLEYNF